jgi:amidohydrolase
MIAPSALDAMLAKSLPDLVRIYKHLHAAPELSHYEEKTSCFMAEKLRSLGYVVTERFGCYENPTLISYGVVAVLHNGAGPAVLYRADMDALPIEEKTGLEYASQVRMKNDDGVLVPVMHACGHDLHCTVLLGIAEMMIRLRSHWRGTLILVAQPAEEVGESGSQAMLSAGLYEKFGKPDYIMALHAAADGQAGIIRFPAEYSMASITNLDILVNGVGSHGAAPHKGKDPILLAAQIILALQTIVSREIDPIDAALITVGSIHGGTQRNVIPEEVVLQLTVRCYQEAVRRQLLSSIERICWNLGFAAGLAADHLPQVRILSYGPAVHNDPGLVSRVMQSMKQVLGENRLEQARPMMGGEDFARYHLDGQIPSALFWLGVVDPQRVAHAQKGGVALPAGHSPFYQIMPEPAIQTGVTAMTWALMDLLKK